MPTLALAVAVLRGVGQRRSSRPATGGRFLLTRPQPQEPGSEDLADFGKAFGGGHPVGVEGVRGHA